MIVIPIPTHVPTQNAKNGWRVLWASQTAFDAKEALKFDTRAIACFKALKLPEDTIIYRTPDGDYWAKKPETTPDEN
jgi:hypothetical protein